VKVQILGSKLQDQFAYAPRGMRAERAAAYLGIGLTKFLGLVDSGRMPQPLRIDGIVVWDRVELDAAFDELKAAPQRSWDKILK
jgi:predicted DNA-binding transcriptional regulator AlpA